MSVAENTEMCICPYVCVYDAPVERGLCKSPVERTLSKAPTQRGCLCTYIHTYAHFSNFFSTDTRDASQSPYREGLCKTPRGLVHTCICTFWSFFLQTWEMALQGPYTEGIL